MDLERLTILPPRAPRPFWAFAEIVFDHGPIAGVLFYDEYPVEAPADAAARETAESIASGGQLQRGWLFWPVGEEAATAAENPWRPLVYVFGPRITVAGALRQAITTLEDRNPPSGTYEESAELVAAMLEVDDLEYLLVPDSWTVPAGGQS